MHDDSLAFISSLQFIREYTGKVDELVKYKIEAQNEVKAKEQEEKDVIAQQVITLQSPSCCCTSERRSFVYLIFKWYLGMDLAKRLSL